MKNKEIINYLKNNIEPVEDKNYGNIYRGSVYLKDDIFFPCVSFINSKKMADLVYRRINEIGDNYDIIKNFFTNCNSINDYDIKEINKSRYAIPKNISEKIESETLMAWTGFILEMSDGKLFNYGTTFDFSFFDLPEKYIFDDVKKIINHSFVLDDGSIQNYRETGIKNIPLNTRIYREKIYFKCYIDNL
jgi:hypothetical protein